MMTVMTVMMVRVGMNEQQQLEFSGLAIYFGKNLSHVGKSVCHLLLCHHRHAFQNHYIETTSIIIIIHVQRHGVLAGILRETDRGSMVDRVGGRSCARCCGRHDGHDGGDGDDVDGGGGGHDDDIIMKIVIGW